MKYISNLPFLAICCFQFLLLICLILKKHYCDANELEKYILKKRLIIILKGFIKQPVIKQSPTFLSFSFLTDCCMSVFLFPYQSVSKFWKNWSDFIDKNQENVKILLEIFCQKLIVSNVTLAFLDHLKPKVFFAGQPWWLT